MISKVGAPQSHVGCLLKMKVPLPHMVMICSKVRKTPVQAIHDYIQEEAGKANQMRSLMKEDFLEEVMVSLVGNGGEDVLGGRGDVSMTGGRRAVLY